MSAPGVSSTIDADPSPFFRALRDVERATKSTFNDVERNVSALTGPINLVYSRFASLAGLLGGSALVMAGRRAIEFGDSLDKASAKAGLTGEAMSELEYAGRLADVSLDTLSNSLSKMQIFLSKAASGGKEQSETLRALGLEVKNLQDLTADRQLEVFAESIRQLANEEDRARAVTEVFGRSGAQLLPLFEQGAAGIKKAREEAIELGVVLKDDQIKALAEADDKVKKMAASWENFAAVLTSKVAPAITAVLDLVTFNAGSPADFQKGKSTSDLQAFLSRLQASDAEGTLTGGERKTMEWIKRELEARRLVVANAAASVYAPGASAMGPGSGSPGYQEDEPKQPKAKRSRADNSVALSDRANSSRRAVIEQELRDAGKYLDDLTDMDNSAAEHRQAMAQAEIVAEEQKLQRMAELGQLSRVQELQGYQDLQQRRFEIDAEALRRKAESVAAEPIERQKANQDLELLEMEHAQRMRELRSREMQAMAQPWNQVFGNMNAGFQNVLRSFARGYATVGQTLRGLAATVLDTFTDMVAQIAAKWLTLKIASLLMSKSTIAGKAAEAGAGGVASMAGAPFPFNLSAPGFGAAMAALAAGYLAIPAAAKGFDIPAGMNPITQLHQREMVLPETLADVVRGMAEGGGGKPGITVSLPGKRVGPGEFLIQERDLVAVLKRLGALNYR